ncbi:MAG: SDR family oxidoreductase [bacterium]|nr:SDR family oxidoreductase [bacterium]MDE0239475.1 SDR family oxidoreductase [bacterium]
MAAMDATDTLCGRVAWVPGGATGIGRAAALSLARRGADVAVGSLTRALMGERVGPESTLDISEETLDEARRLIEAAGVRALALPLDTGNEESVASHHAAVVKALGPVDILVHTAGMGGRMAMISHTTAFWDRVINVNLSGPFRTVRAVFPGMVARGWGRIVIVASTAASVGERDGGAARGASKAGLLGLMRCIALEGAACGVTCNAVSPGHVDTQQSRRAVESLILQRGLDTGVEEFLNESAARLPQQRHITAEEIGAAIAFLCGDGARGITGENLTIAGGSLW